VLLTVMRRFGLPMQRQFRPLKNADAMPPPMSVPGLRIQRGLCAALAFTSRNISSVSSAFCSWPSWL